MTTNRARETNTADGGKTAHWERLGSRPLVRWIMVPHGSESERVDVSLELADAREKYPGHADLWDAVQGEYWRTLFDTSGLPIV